MGGEREDFEDGFEGGVNQGRGMLEDGGGLEALLGIPAGGDGDPGIGSVIEPAPAFPPRAPVGVEQDNGAARGSDKAGNTERGRDLNPSSPNTSGPQQGGFNLPQGVSVNEGMFGGAPPGNAMQTPSMSMEPNPVASQTPNPMFSQPESGTNRGPQRRSPQAPAIFAQGNSPGLAGRAGGLMGGGLGATGQGEASGPLNPSALFQKLMQMFQNG